MSRYLMFLILAFIAVAGERPLPNPEILKWQAEAQARERAINRRVESQLAKIRAPQPAKTGSEPKPSAPPAK